MKLLPAIASRPWLVWLVFGLTYAAVFAGTIPLLARGEAGGDVSVYQHWVEHAFRTGSWPVFDYDWVYPAGALLVILLPAALGTALYQATWLVIITIVNGLALWMLLDRAKRRHDLTAPWFWVATIAILAPVALMRLEGIVAPLAVVALLVATARPRVAGFVLAAVTWIKVWPAAIVVAAVVASSRRWIVVVTGVLTSAVVIGIVVMGGGVSHLASFVGEQGARPLQVEAPLATPWLWMSIAGVPGARIFHDHVLITEQVTGPGDGWLVANGTMLMLAIMAVVVVILAIATHRLAVFARPLGRELDLVLLGSLGLATTFIVFNKVGSPQYLLWLTPIVAAGLLTKRLEWLLPAVLLLAACVLTTLVYPVFYNDLLQGHVGAGVLLGARNALLVAIFVWSVVRLSQSAFARVQIPLGTRPFGSGVRSTSY